MAGALWQEHPSVAELSQEKVNPDPAVFLDAGNVRKLLFWASVPNTHTYSFSLSLFFSFSLSLFPSLPAPHNLSSAGEKEIVGIHFRPERVPKNAGHKAKADFTLCTFLSEQKFSEP